MKYDRVIKATFVNRPNRFIAKVIVDGKEETAHVKNTGRCKELLIKGCNVYLNESDNPLRKTKYDLIAVEKIKDNGSCLLINIDSQIPNSVAEEFIKNGNLFSKNAVIKREVTYNNSRFDIFVEDEKEKAFVEVKGVTLENDGIAMFPDAPTVRGVKHVTELIDAKRNGYRAIILFVVQMKGVNSFKPNVITHPQFAEILKEAKNTGVEIYAVDCIVTKESIIADSYIKTEV
ncbi:MAG: DNA/RNA nuclease SfsA [Acutalibacteraceae bacterium]|nr:DNA/RNA nuclease SfsA [Acutalibacteraceae bacterium]